jgi:hypothetical protein
MNRRRFIQTVAATSALSSLQTRRGTAQPRQPAAVVAPNVNIDDLHDGVTTICGDQAGLFVREAYFKSLLVEQLRDTIPGVKRNGGLQTSVKDIGVSFDVDVATLSLSVRPSSIADQPDVVFQPFNLDVIVHVLGDPTKEFSRIRYSYGDLIARISAQAGNILLRYVSSRWTGSITPDANRQALIASLNWNAQQIADLERLESVTAVLMGDAVASQLVDTIGFPPLLGAFKGLSFSGALRLEVLRHANVGSGVVVTGQDTFLARAHCPPGGAEKEISIAYDSANSGTGSAGPFKFVSNTNTPAVTPNNNQDPARSILFVYLPQSVLDVAFPKSAAPGLQQGASGTWQGVNYEWSLSVGLTRLAVEIESGKPSLIVKIKGVIAGHASAWIQVGCVTQPLGTVTLTGEIDPLNIRATLVLDRPEQHLLLRSEIVACTVRDVVANVTGPPWPLDIIVSAIIRHNAPGMISKQIVDAVNSGRIDVADLATLRRGLLYNFNYTSYNARPTKSLLFGIGEQG